MSQSFAIPVEPVAKGRPRVVRMKTGASVTYTPDKTVDAEERIRWHLRSLGAREAAPGAAVRLSVTFAVRQPKSKKRAIAPVSRPDLDQYLKLLLDASNGILFADDSQVVSIQANKVYAQEGYDPHILLEVEEL